MAIVQASTKPTITAPTFNVHAANIVKAYGRFDAASVKFAAELSRTMNQYVDACRTAEGIGKDEASCKAMQSAIRKADAFERAIADGLLLQKTITEYAQGAARALHYGVEWTPTLKNDPEMSLPWGKKGAGKGAKSGKVVTTDRAALEATLQKALQQARALSLDGFAAELFDVISETLDGFTEGKTE